jgi:hypothetical protein
LGVGVIGPHHHPFAQVGLDTDQVARLARFLHDTAVADPQDAFDTSIDLTIPMNLEGSACRGTAVTIG